MTKTKAALIHLLISIFIIGLLVLTIVFIWYPKPFFEISGVSEPLKLLLLVDVVIGPLLTFLVYKKNKKYLKIDLTLIAIMQIAAFGYGMHTIYGGRPSMVVFKGGEFNFLSYKFAKNEDIKFDELKPHFFSSPILSQVKQTNVLDIYATYADMDIIEDFKTTLLPYSLNASNMKAKFKDKADVIDEILKKYKTEDIIFLLLDKELSKYYIVFSLTQQSIVDYIKF